MLTSSQQTALDTSRHLSVTANAGSGKTMVLVERYINILISGKARVNEVVAITFTEKAASELKRKISEGVAKRIAEATDVRTKNALEEIREQLSAAVVDTIHSFCSRILREYPVEAGVDAAFTVVEVVDQQVMLEAAMKETFESILREDGESPRRERLFEVLRALGKFRVLDIVHTLALKREQVQRWILPGGIYSRPDDEIVTSWRAHLSEYVKSEFQDPTVMNDLESVIEAAKPNALMVLRPTFNAFKRSGNLNERLKLFGDLLEQMLTQKGELRKKMFGDDDSVTEQAGRLKAKFKSLSPLIQFVTDERDETHRTLLKYSRVLLELYQNAIERYEEKKLESAYLDFEDLQLRTRNLLRSDKVRQKLAQRYRFIMVDEYQDTNLLQYEILLPLVNSLSAGNLFIVGDPKQSIYGFRNADVSVFQRTKGDIEQQVGKNGSVVLAESFRLLHDLAAFVNRVFLPLMNGSESDFDVSYEPLVRGRQNSAPGRVEVIVRDESRDEEKVITEGELLARRIVQLHAQEYQIFGKDEKPRDVGFSDFAILIRSRTGLADLEEALIHHHIPYLVSSGVGYFQTQGIYDFYNYFRFLLNTDDDVALTGILRSPFFTISDAELYEVSLERRGTSLWGALASGRGKVTLFPSLLRAVELLRNHSTIASRLSVPDLINRIIDETAYAGFVAGTHRAAQTFANLEKLKRVARGYERQGFTTLFDFTARLKRLTEQEDQEGQAAVDVTADAVKVMTIHAAKGLEFPVVIVPGLDRSFRFDNELFLDDELGMGFGALSANGENEQIPVAEFLKRKSRAKTVAEEKRIFYVACTRARDLLILSGLQKEKRSSDNYMNWLLDGLQVQESIAEPSLSFGTSTAFLKSDKNVFTTINQSHRVRVHVLRPDDLDLVTSAASTFSPPKQISQLMIDPIRSEPQGEIFSASKIRTYVECPSKYYLRYVAGLPSRSIRMIRDEIDEENDAEIPADLRGSAFHYVMQHIDEIGNDRKTIAAELRRFVARDSYTILSEPSIDLDTLAQSVLDVLGSAYWNDVSKGSDTRTEFTIMTKLGSDFLTGTIDRIYRDENNVWHVLDYKTDTLEGQGLQEKIDQYEPQVKFYSLLLAKYFSATKVCAHLLFTSLVSKPVMFTYTHDDLWKFESEISAVISSINSNKFSRNSKRPCAGCPFLPSGCPNLD